MISTFNCYWFYHFTILFHKWYVQFYLLLCGIGNLLYNFVELMCPLSVLFILTSFFWVMTTGKYSESWLAVKFTVLIL